MICPNCGHDIQDGHLICEKCGYELQIVPEFEPEIEIDIDHIAVDDILESENKDILEDTSELSDINEIDVNRIKHKILVILIISLASIIIVAIAFWIVLRTSSLEYQLNNIKKHAEAGKYELAISSLENLYVSNPENSDLLFLEAQYYSESSKSDMAIDTLMRVINSPNFSDDDIKSAYDRLISIYVQLEDYNSINGLLANCQYPDVCMNYQNYMAIEPMFSVDGGEYDESFNLKLSANTSGVIYYTLDGSVPNDSSTKYEIPFLLEHGEYIVSAIFVNQYGVESDMVTQTYIISSEIPDEPVVNIDSGAYTTPSLITVEVPEGMKVFYTTDKSIPTEDSVQYIDPIPMPIGYSNFSFIVINDQGLCSDVVVRSYKLDFPTGLSTDQAVNALKTRLIERGLINDNQGTSERAPGKYTYKVISAIPITGQGDYYTIREFYNDGSGDLVATDTTYIVEIYQGSTAILGGDAKHGFLAISF